MDKPMRDGIYCIYCDKEIEMKEFIYGGPPFSRLYFKKDIINPDFRNWVISSEDKDTKAWHIDCKEKEQPKTRLDRMREISEEVE